MLECRYIQEGDKELLEGFQCEDESTVRDFLLAILFAEWGYCEDIRKDEDNGN
jgi:hypothetical protein